MIKCGACFKNNISVPTSFHEQSYLPSAISAQLAPQAPVKASDDEDVSGRKFSMLIYISDFLYLRFSLLCSSVYWISFGMFHPECLHSQGEGDIEFS